MGIIIGILLILSGILLPRLGAKQGYLNAVKENPAGTKPRYFDITPEYLREYRKFEHRERVRSFCAREVERLAKNIIVPGDMITITNPDWSDMYPINTPMRIKSIKDGKRNGFDNYIYGGRTFCENHLEKAIWTKQFNIIDKDNFFAFLDIINPQKTLDNPNARDCATIVSFRNPVVQERIRKCIERYENCPSIKEYHPDPYEVYGIHPDDVLITKYDDGNTYKLLDLPREYARRAERIFKYAEKENVELGDDMRFHEEFDFSPYHEWSKEKIYY